MHYTVALDRPFFGAGRPRAVLLSNRSACFLKLGDHDKALADAEAAAELDVGGPRGSPSRRIIRGDESRRRRGCHVDIPWSTPRCEATRRPQATYAKAHFRSGLALHALGRYRDALPCLGAARDLEPRNKQIADAIKFAEMRLARGG